MEWIVNDEFDLARTLLRNLDDSIDIVANLDYQRRVWLGETPRSQGERSSFVEVYYTIIQDVDVDIVRKHRKRLKISDFEWELLLIFLVRFLAYAAEINDVYAEAAIVSDPEWAIVVSAAQEALAARLSRSRTADLDGRS